LAVILREASAAGDSQAAVARKVAEELPELKSFADLLPQKRTELYAFLSLIIALIAILLAQRKAPAAAQVTIQQVFSTVISSSAASAPKATPGPSSSNTVPPVGRNEPCPCGSGKKYKKCHMAQK
jgi:preprotein translocase subunit SecA